MKQKIHISLFLFFTTFCFAQITAIQDSTTKEPIPYVNIWVDGKNIEFNADENGNFTLSDVDASSSIILSAVGYTNTTLKISDINKVIHLTPKPIELGEVTIGNKKGKHSQIVNPIKKAKNTWMGVGGGASGPLMAARYFQYKAEYAATPFIDKIRFETKTYHDNTFNIRLCMVNPDGSPGDYLYNENILVTVKKGQENTKIDFSKISLRIPEEGFFVVVEHITTKENKLIDSKEQSDQSVNFYIYGPSFLCEASDTQVGWYYRDGVWKQGPKLEKGYAKIVAEVTLTD